MSHASTDTWESSIEFFDKVSEQAIKRYEDADNLTVRLLDYSENATYLVQNSATGEKHILRVCRPDYHTQEEIESEIKWLQSIDEHTPVIVSRPIQGMNNDYIQSIKLENQPLEYHCVMFTFLEGEAPDVDKEEKLIKVFEDIGETTAQFHNHVIHNKDLLQGIVRPIWNYDTLLGEKPKWGRWQDGLAITPERKELFTQASEVIKLRLEKFGQDSSRFGLIHADLRHANLLVVNGEVKVIDFDDSGYGWYLYDLAASLTFIEHREYVPQLIESWLKGYRKVRPLSQEEENEIPTFIMMRRLQLIAWVGSRQNETTEELGSEYTEQTDELALEYLKKFNY